MQEHIYLLTLGLPLGAFVIIFSMKYYSVVVAARSRLESDAAYSALAEKSIAAQLENQTALAHIQAELAKANASIAAVEKVLKQVE